MVGSIIVALPGFWYHQLGAHGKHTLWDASGEVIAQLCLTGFLSWMAQMSKTTGLKIAKTMGVLVARYLDIVFCFAWDVWFLNGTLDPRSVCGSVVIIFGCLVSVVMKKGS
jgi:drug/metabolite transporter (DMT)-like permease